MSGADLFTLGFDAVVPALWGVAWHRLVRPREWWRLPLAWGAMAFGCVLGASVSRHWLDVAVSAANVLIALAIWWWRRKKRRNVAALVGAKSRALRDAIVRKARELATPRPVLRPVPVPR